MIDKTEANKRLSRYAHGLELDLDRFVMATVQLKHDLGKKFRYKSGIDEIVNKAYRLMGELEMLEHSPEKFYKIGE